MESARFEANRRNRLISENDKISVKLRRGVAIKNIMHK
jgi:hypothetical protein